MSILRIAAPLVLASVFLLGVATPAWAWNEETTSDSFHKLACASYPPSSSPWHIRNLYDCGSRKMFVPYHLWTGTKWDGRKDGPCMHRADNTFTVNDRSETRIWGPKKWLNVESGEEEMVWVREKVRGFKEQYFTCHQDGIGRVYDSRGPRYWFTGRCKFPAGRGWKIRSRRDCEDTALEITHVGLDDKGRLKELEFKYWSRSRLDHIYRYVPNQGMTNAWKQ